MLMASLSEAIAEAMAMSTQGPTYYEGLVFDHPSWAEPLALISGYKESATIDLPLTFGGPLTTFFACGMQVTQPSEGPDGVTGMKLVISALASDINQHLKDASLGTDAIEVTYYQYLSSDLTTPGEIISGAELHNVTLEAGTASGELTFEEIDTQAFPLFTYDEEFYPMLQVPGDDEE